MKLTTKPEFSELSLAARYAKLHETELRINQLERIIETIYAFKDSSTPYKDAVEEYKQWKLSNE